MTVKTLLRSAIAITALGIPLVLGGCASQESVDKAMAAAQNAQATADQALSTAQSASAKADAAAAQAAEANRKADAAFQKSLAK